MAENEYSILILRYSSMGDVILVAPLISVLRNRFPDAFIGMITFERYAEVYRDDARLSRVFPVTRGEVYAGDDLTGRRWDRIVDLQCSRRSAKQISRLKYDTLSRFDKLRLERNLLLYLRINRYVAVESVARRYIAASGETPGRENLNYRIPFDIEQKNFFYHRVQEGDIDRPVIVLFPFCAWRNKEWGDRRYTAVGRFFSVKGWNVVIMGGDRDRQRAGCIQTAIGKRCISLVGEMSLYECGCILRHCNLALGGDSGLSHLARACGVKTGFLFGPTTKEFGFQPLDDSGCTVFQRQRFCRPCHPHGGNICWRLDHGCMRGIKPDEVINGLMSLHLS